MLLNSAFAFIKKPDLVKHITDIPSISRRMLLAGPPGMPKASPRALLFVVSFLLTSTQLLSITTPQARRSIRRLS
jgi:hypothetical protein